MPHRNKKSATKRRYNTQPSHPGCDSSDDPSQPKLMDHNCTGDCYGSDPSPSPPPNSEVNDQSMDDGDDILFADGDEQQQQQEQDDADAELLLDENLLEMERKPILDEHLLDLDDKTNLPPVPPSTTEEEEEQQQQQQQEIPQKVTMMYSQPGRPEGCEREPTKDLEWLSVKLRKQARERLREQQHQNLQLEHLNQRALHNLEQVEQLQQLQYKQEQRYVNQQRYKPCTVKFACVHPKAICPIQATDNSAGYDIFSPVDVTIPAESSVGISLGYKLIIDKDHYLEMKNRSGLAIQKNVEIKGQPCTIDPDFRGVVKMFLYNYNDTPYHVRAGNKIGQFLAKPKIPINWVPVDQINNGDEGSTRYGGFGSTGD